MELKPRRFEEALAFWQDKVKLSPKEFYALKAEARAKAFTVSGMAKESEIADLFTGIEKAIAEGIPFGEFKKHFRELFERKGWVGKGAWRIETIFRTNIQSAYSAGRYKQMTHSATVKALPYWMYDAVNDSRTRPLHRAMDGRVFRADDPIWDTWYPPNGFNCRCRVVALTEERLKRMGKVVEDGERVNGKPIPLVDTHGNPTGMVQNLLPDPDWEFNPGKVHWGDAFVKRALKDKEKYELADTVGFKDRHRPDVRELEVHPFPGEPWQGLSKGETKKRFAENLAGKVLKDAVGSPVIISNVLLDHILAKGERDKIRRLEYLPFIGDLVESPEEIWLQTYKKKKTGSIRLRRLYLKRYGEAEKGRSFILVAEAIEGSWTGWTYFPSSGASRVNNRRKGYLIWHK